MVLVRRGGVREGRGGGVREGRGVGFGGLGLKVMTGHTCAVVMTTPMEFLGMVPVWWVISSCFWNIVIGSWTLYSYEYAQTDCSTCLKGSTSHLFCHIWTEVTTLYGFAFLWTSVPIRPS